MINQNLLFPDPEFPDQGLWFFLEPVDLMMAHLLNVMDEMISNTSTGTGFTNVIRVRACRAFLFFVAG